MQLHYCKIDCLFSNRSTILVSFFSLFHKNTMYGANVVIFEGIMAFCNDEICKVGSLDVLKF